MYCSKCGELVDGGARFCGHCGEEMLLLAGSESQSGSQAPSDAFDTTQAPVTGAAVDDAPAPMEAEGGGGRPSRIVVIALAVLAAVAIVGVVVAIALHPHGEDVNTIGIPESIGEVKTSYELFEVGDYDSLKSQIALRVGQNGMVAFENGDVVISGKLDDGQEYEDSIIYNITDLRGGGSGSAVSPSDTMKLMIPKKAEKGSVIGKWRLTIKSKEGFTTLWAEVWDDKTAVLGASEDDGFESGWEPAKSEGIDQTWTKDGNGVFTFTDESGDQLRVVMDGEKGSAGV